MNEPTLFFAKRQGNPPNRKDLKIVLNILKPALVFELLTPLLELK